MIDIKELHQNFIVGLHEIFKLYQGDNSVTFEVLELERIKKEVAVKPIDTIPLDIEESEGELIEDLDLDLEDPGEEFRVLNKLAMPSRKLKVKISNELLSNLENMKVDFKLN
jgi:DNA polymerase-3 subunit alpha